MHRPTFTDSIIAASGGRKRRQGRPADETHTAEEAPPPSKPSKEDLCFRAGEPVGESLVRIAKLLAGVVRARLSHPSEVDPEDVHAARTAIKRWRALLAGVEPVIDADAYAAEQSRLRRAMTMLGGTRDRDVMLQTLAELAGRAKSEKKKERILVVRAALARLMPGEDAAERGATATEIGRLMQRSAKAMAQFRALGGDWEVLQPGLAKTFEAQAKRMSRAADKGRSQDFHRWRITLKRLGYQLEWVAPAWPKRLEKLAHRIEKIEKRLGKLHDLAVLQETIERKAVALGGKRAAKSTLGSIGAWSRKLGRSCVKAGGKIGKKIDAKFWGRLGKRWKRMAA